MIAIPRILLFCGVLVVSLAGCRWFPGGGDPVSSDSLEVAISDTILVADSLHTDTTSVVALQVPDTLEIAPATALDSLRLEIDRLHEAIAALTGANTPTQASTDSTTLAADSLLAASTTERIQQRVQATGNFTLRVIWSIFVVFLSFLLVKGIVWVLEALSERSATRRLLFKRMVPIVRIIVWSTVVYYIMAAVFDLTRENILAASAALGIAIGFAAQDILKNIFGGILIILDQPFQVGDKISVGGTYGEVKSIGLRSTRIQTPDDNLVSVPNAQVVEGQVSNANTGALDCQVVIELYVPGWADVMKAKEIAYSAAANSKYVFLDKPIVVNVKDVFKETFLTELKVKAYVLDTRYEFVFASDVTETAKMEFLHQGLLSKALPANPYPDMSNGTASASSTSDAS